MFQEISQMNSQDLSSYCKLLVDKHQKYIKKPEPIKILQSNLYQIKSYEPQEYNRNRRFLIGQEPNEHSIQEDFKLKYSQLSYRPGKKNIEKKEYSNSHNQDTINFEESFISRTNSPKRVHKFSNSKTISTRKQSFQDMNQQIQILKSQVNQIAETLKTEEPKNDRRTTTNFTISHYFYLLQEIQYLRDRYMEHYESICKQPYIRQQCEYLRDKFSNHYDNFHKNEKNQIGVNHKKI